LRTQELNISYMIVYEEKDIRLFHRHSQCQ
jgi:hypothetical protein